MVRLVVKNFFRPECLEKAAELYREMVAETQKEDGCIQYDLFIDENDETAWVLLEQWESRAHLDAHIATGHFKRLIPQLGELQDAGRAGGATFLKEFA
jgi:quinol monooxygenase YgiN